EHAAKFGRRKRCAPESIQHSVGRNLKVTRAVDQGSIEVENDRNNLRQVVSFPVGVFASAQDSIRLGHFSVAGSEG
ncbi:MAG TPA: hypothetical protein VN882_02930, partial [Steroidobacteraceae bacterium]|nr:hypothetical protein [Steroidobacteraceae bacterium]